MILKANIIKNKDGSALISFHTIGMSIQVKKGDIVDEVIIERFLNIFEGAKNAPFSVLCCKRHGIEIRVCPTKQLYAFILSRRRKYLGISKKDIAEIAGCRVCDLTAYESGKILPNALIWSNLMVALDIESIIQ